jgi:hypothetical protein
MRPFVIAAIIASLTVPAFAEEDPSKVEEYKAVEQKKKEEAEIERAYKNAVKGSTREQPVKKSDPWGSVRQGGASSGSGQ